MYPKSIIQQYFSSTNPPGDSEVTTVLSSKLCECSQAWVFLRVSVSSGIFGLVAGCRPSCIVLQRLQNLFTSRNHTRCLAVASRLLRVPTMWQITATLRLLHCISTSGWLYRDQAALPTLRSSTTHASPPVLTAHSHHLRCVSCPSARATSSRHSVARCSAASVTSPKALGAGVAPRSWAKAWL